MFPIAAKFLELAEDSDPAELSPCDRHFRERLTAQVHQSEALPEDSDDKPQPSDGDSFEVKMVLNPKAWGRFKKHEPAIFRISRSPDLMRVELAREVKAAFGIGSWPLVDQLAVGVFGLERFNSLDDFGPSGALHGGRAGDGLMKVLDERIEEDRQPLWVAFQLARGQLRERVIAYEALIESYACCRASNEELPACDSATLDEARRYLSLVDRSDRGVRAALAPTSQLTQALTGPDGRALVAAAKALAGPLRGFRAAQERYRLTLPESFEESAKGALWLTLLGPLSFPLQAQRMLQQGRALMMNADERAIAALELSKHTQEFQEAFADTATRYPILFKVGDHVGEDEGTFTRRIVDSLHDALDASAELAKVLPKEPASVWRFPGLIDRSVALGFPHDLPFAQRVAANRSMAENETPVFARINAGIQLLDGTLTLVPSPHVKLVMALATVVGDAAELLESYFRTKEQRLGHRASIDPGRALGPSASYFSTLLQAAFLGIGLLPIKGAVKELAAEGAQAEKARRATMQAVN